MHFVWKEKDFEYENDGFWDHKVMIVLLDQWQKLVTFKSKIFFACGEIIAINIFSIVSLTRSELRKMSYRLWTSQEN